MSAKARRQQAVTRLIEASEIASQSQLVELLSAEGISATQATVSRDLDDIGAIKIRSSAGQSVYALPVFAPDRIAPLDQLRRVMGEWVAEVTHSPITWWPPLSTEAGLRVSLERWPGMTRCCAWHRRTSAASDSQNR